MRALLHAVHERQQLRHDPSLHLSVSLLPLGSDRVQLINENNGRRIFVGLFEGLAQIALGLAGQLAHDLGAVDQEEEGPGLVGDGTSYQGLSRTGRAVQQDAARRFHAYGLEERRVAQRELHHFLDLGQLFAAAAYVVVADRVEDLFFLLFLRRIYL